MSSRMMLAKLIGYPALAVFLFLIPLFVKEVYVLHILIMVAISIILTSSLQLINTTGQLSLAHAGFMAIGAYTSGLLVTRLSFSTWGALPLAGLAACAIAFLVGYPFVRVKGIYFIILTLFFAEVIRLIITWRRDLTGGYQGLTNIPPPDPIILGLVNIDFASKADFYYFALALTLITLLVLYGIERSRIGLTFSAIQQADYVAESVGINTAKFKVLAFAIGCFFAGIAGAFYCHYILVINPSAFSMMLAFYIMVYMVVGGQNKLSGAVLGAGILTAVPEVFRMLKEYQPFIFAAVLILVVFFLREGLIGLPERVKRAVGRLGQERRSHA